MKRISEVRRVLAATTWDYSYAREATAGLLAYSAERGGWHTTLARPGTALSSVYSEIQPAGIVGLVHDLLGSNVNLNLPPVVAWYESASSTHRSAVTLDEVAIGTMAAEYLLKCGFDHLACVHQEGLFWSDNRVDGFSRCVRAAGRNLIVFECGKFDPQLRNYTMDLVEYRANSGRVDWLKSLPKPVGIFTGNDVEAKLLLEAAHVAGLSVPTEVALLGTDDDAMLCLGSHPTISSIRLPHYQLGYESGRLLEALMAGGAVNNPAPLSPVGVIARGSTDTIAIADRDVAAAVHFIRANSHQIYTPDQIAEHVSIGRRSLERRFKLAVGRTMMDEVRRARVERVKRLLVDTDLMMPEIAERCGFTDASALTVGFRALTDQTPTQYRRANRTIRLRTDLTVG